MLSRQFPRFRVPVSGLAVGCGFAFSVAVAAQTPEYPSVPPAEPAPASSLPSLPAAVPQQQQQVVPVPPQSVPSSSTQRSAPAYQDPLQAPIPVNPSSPGNPQNPNQPGYNQQLEAPILPPAPSGVTPNAQPGVAPASPSNGTASTPAGATYPLETPIHVQSAQPGEPQPVSIAPPAPVAMLPSIPVEYEVSAPKQPTDHLGSTYIPVDDVIYPMALRLYSMGYLDTIFIGMRPWTRRSLLHALEKSAPRIQEDANPEAQAIYAKLMDFLTAEDPGPAGTLSNAMTRGQVYGLDTAYTRLMGITGLTLRDSYHLGQTLVNDYGRPYEPGFNNITGFSTVNEWGRFSLYVRGEYQHAPSAAGYSYALASYDSAIDEITPFVPPQEPNIAIPYGPIPSANPFRLQEAALSFHVLGHEISGGKSDAWLGPAAGGAMAWSDNAENIYSFRINRVEPLNIPYLDKVLGALRYDFFVGSLKGHTYPNSPWVHAEMFSFRPSSNFEFAFERTVIWGGEGHVPITFGSFFRSFFSIQDTESDPTSKNSRQDPGARFSDFSFSYRLPFLRKHVTLYADSITHDDVTPVSAPRRAAYRPGIYLSQFPGIPKLDLRVEASSTDCSTLRCQYGVFQYFEAVQRNGYTNKGFIMGDWVGREAKAGNASLTYHLSSDEWIALDYLHKQNPQDFILSGTTQNQFKLDVMKRLTPNLELNAWYQYERWVAPIYKTGVQHDNIISFQFKWYPKLHTKPEVGLNGKPLFATPTAAQQP